MENCINTPFIEIHQADAYYLYVKKSAKNKKGGWMILDGKFVTEPIELTFSMIHPFILSVHVPV